MKVGLTGGIGSGKTTVSELFEALDVPVIDADVIARSLLEPGTETTKQVINIFGKEIAIDTGEIDRTKLRERVFNDADARKKLESILHPIVHQRIREQIAGMSSPYCIIVIPLLFEAGHQDLVDRVLVVDTTRENQIRRAASRDQVSAPEIQKILDSQIDPRERLARADDVIENNNGIEQLRRRVQELDTFYRGLRD
ncbi:MAG: dephospho-CoA kinase [Acidiferrobacterales bacterium]|nr:dephospho-CoA kinase [Acidiferrobacterales bacterium]